MIDVIPQQLKEFYNPVSADGSLNNFWSSLKTGKPESGANPNMTLSVVIKFAPIFSIAFNAYFLKKKFG